MPVGSRAVRFAWLGTPKFGWLRMLNISARKCSDLVSPNANCLKREKSQLTSLGPISVDRKSTRLNSSHGYISYAVFCLKKKKNMCDSMWKYRGRFHRPSPRGHARGGDIGRTRYSIVPDNGVLQAHHRVASAARRLRQC